LYDSFSSKVAPHDLCRSTVIDALRAATSFDKTTHCIKRGAILIDVDYFDVCSLGKSSAKLPYFQGHI
jgi:hypothetical protein